MLISERLNVESACFNILTARSYINSSPCVRAERAKLKSRRDDLIVAQGQAAEAAALGKTPPNPTSFFPSGLARHKRAKPEGKKNRFQPAA
jgi:hypothetical protein